jgi:hypothetical protein
MRVWKLAPWLVRLIVAAVAALFAMIGFKFAFDPQHSAASSGVSIVSSVGITNIRAGFGGFPLGLALILIYSLFSTHRLRTALGLIVIMAAAILSVRLYGAIADRTLAESAHLLIPEAVILMAALLGGVLEARRIANDRPAR